MVDRLYDVHVRPLQADDLNDYMDTVVRAKLGIIPDDVKFGGGKAAKTGSLTIIDFPCALHACGQAQHAPLPFM